MTGCMETGPKETIGTELGGKATGAKETVGKAAGVKDSTTSRREGKVRC